MSPPWTIPDNVVIAVMLTSIGLVAYIVYGLFAL
jgi:hypothetical protein